MQYEVESNVEQRLEIKYRVPGVSDVWALTKKKAVYGYSGVN